MTSTLKMIKGKDFLEGSMENTVATDGFSITLKDNERVGVYTTPLIHLPDFKSAVLSWNTTTSVDSSVEIRAKVGYGTDMGTWLSYGIWSKGNRASAKNQKDHLAKLSIDELIVDRLADTIQIEVTMKRDEGGKPPVLHLLAVAIEGTKRNSHALDFKPLKIDVPQISQMLVPEIGNQICSPTSVTMLMNYHGREEDESITAKNAFDHGADIYGNWSFNMAYAGEMGFEAYVERCPSLRVVYDYLKQGIPVAASIKTPKDDPIPGAPQGYPSGHLLVIKGFDWVDNEPYVIVNDPASKTLEEVERLYPIDAFEKAWANIIYVVKPRE